MSARVVQAAALQAAPAALVAIAPMAPDERSYVIATWTRSKPITAGRVSTAERDAMIARLVDEQRVLVAQLPDGTAAGWVCYTPLRSTAIVHYLYTRKAIGALELRRRGIGRALVQRAAVDLARPVPYTFTGPMFASLIRGAGVATQRFDPTDILD